MNTVFGVRWRSSGLSEIRPHGSGPDQASPRRHFNDYFIRNLGYVAVKNGGG